MAAKLGRHRAAVHRHHGRRPRPRIDAIDLDRPLGDTAAVLDELEEVYLRDAVYFHHPRYLAHLNCPVVIPAAARRGGPLRRQLLPGHLGPVAPAAPSSSAG